MRKLIGEIEVGYNKDLLLKSVSNLTEEQCSNLVSELVNIMDYNSDNIDNLRGNVYKLVSDDLEVKWQSEKQEV